MIVKGERLILTGYDDVLHVRLESFVVDGWRPEKYIERKVTWEMLARTEFDVLQMISQMREKSRDGASMGTPPSRFGSSPGHEPHPHDPFRVEAERQWKELLSDENGT